MNEEIVIRIANGKATVEANGYVGKACQDATAEFERVLGQTTNDDKKPEWDLEQDHVVGH